MSPEPLNIYLYNGSACHRISHKSQFTTNQLTNTNTCVVFFLVPSFEFCILFLHPTELPIKRNKTVNVSCIAGILTLK